MAWGSRERELELESRVTALESENSILRQRLSMGTQALLDAEARLDSMIAQVKEATARQDALNATVVPVYEAIQADRKAIAWWIVSTRSYSVKSGATRNMLRRIAYEIETGEFTSGEDAS